MVGATRGGGRLPFPPGWGLILFFPLARAYAPESPSSSLDGGACTSLSKRRSSRSSWRPVALRITSRAARRLRPRARSCEDCLRRRSWRWFGAYSLNAFHPSRRNPRARSAKSFHSPALRAALSPECGAGGWSSAAGSPPADEALLTMCGGCAFRSSVTKRCAASARYRRHQQGKGRSNTNGP